jgi:hypothetical protein
LGSLRKPKWHACGWCLKSRYLQQRFVQHFKLLADKFAAQGSHSSDVAARPIEAGDKALLNQIDPKTDLAVDLVTVECA